MSHGVRPGRVDQPSDPSLAVCAKLSDKLCSSSFEPAVNRHIDANVVGRRGRSGRSPASVRENDSPGDAQPVHNPDCYRHRGCKQLRIAERDDGLS